MVSILYLLLCFDGSTVQRDDAAVLFKSPADSELRLQVDVCRVEHVKLGLGLKTLDSFPACSSLRSMFWHLTIQRPFLAEETSLF